MLAALMAEKERRRRAREGGSVSIHAELRTALERARDSHLLIKPEQEKLRPLVDAARTDVERAARLYQIDLIGWQLERASALAQKRIDHFAGIVTDEDVRAEQLKCAADLTHWFEYYAWGVDPRPDAPLSVMPFALFPFQETFCEWLEAQTFAVRASGVVEKSRDMGATETALRWMLHQWLYREQFTGLVLSLNEDLVDSKKDPGTLFEKLRFQMRLLPSWMLPEGFDLYRDMPYMMIAHPSSGSVLQGDAPTPNVGRQRRATFVLGDEFAAWGNGGYPQHTAVSRTTNTFCAVSSVQGRFNKFAELAHDGRTAKFVMDWREHPWRDSRWYDALPFGHVGNAMTAEQIAQEVDRDYSASQPGKVFKQWREEYVLITRSELIAYYERHQLGRKFLDPVTGSFRVPEGWGWGRMMDYGQTEGHPWIVTHGATPPENYPLSDSFFIFSMLRVSPTGASPAEGYEQWKAVERDLQLPGEPDLSEASHEQGGRGGLLETLAEKYGDNWSPWDTDYTVGLTQIQEWLTLIDTHAPNPFRPELMGRARVYCVADDSEYQFAFDQRNARYFVTPSEGRAMYKLFREEMPGYHYPPEELGKPVQKMRPKKIKDDCIDTVRGFAVKWGPSAPRLTREQRIISRIPQHLKPHNVMGRLGQPDFVELYTAQQHAMQMERRREEEEDEKFRKGWARSQGRPLQHGR